MSVEDTFVLPADYVILRKVNLAKDKHINLVIQLCFVFITTILIGIALWNGLPLTNDINPFFSFVITIFLVVVYMSLHELTHAFFIKLFSKRRPSFRIRFPFLSVGSEAYFNRRSFIAIALAPVLIWGTLLIFLLFFVPSQIFLSFYVVLILNFAGSGGDYAQAYVALKSPAGTLLQDNGKETILYTTVNRKKDLRTN